MSDENVYRYGKTGKLVIGDVFRATGGPTFRGVRTGRTGLYRLLGIVQQKSRIFLEAVQVNKYGIQSGGVHLLYVRGRPYPLAGFDDWLVQPYKVQKSRKLSQ